MGAGRGVGVESAHSAVTAEGLTSRDMVGWGCFGRKFLSWIRVFEILKIVWLDVNYNKIISKDVHTINHDWHFWVQSAVSTLLAMSANYYIFNISLKKPIPHRLVKSSEEKNCPWPGDIKRTFCKRKNIFHHIILKDRTAFLIWKVFWIKFWIRTCAWIKRIKRINVSSGVVRSLSGPISCCYGSLRSPR